MVWTWVSWKIKKAIYKMGLVGKIASKYLMAGYSVVFNVKTSKRRYRFYC